jgi:hypothetical protein
MKSLLLVAVAVLWIAPSLAYAAAPPITKTEAWSLPPQVVEQRVVQQLGDLLVLEPQSLPPLGPDGRRTPPTWPLTKLRFETRPRLNEVAGLCSFESIQVDFNPVGDNTGGGDRPVKASGLSATTRYRFLRPPKTASGEPEGDEDWAPDTAACARLDPMKAAFFAVDGASAVRGAWLLHSAVLQAASPAPPFVIECDAGVAAAADKCRALLAGLDAGKLYVVESCDVYTGHPPTSDCFRVESGGFVVDIHASPGGDAPQITKVRVEREPLVIFGSRIEKW